MGGDMYISGSHNSYAWGRKSRSPSPARKLPIVERKPLTVEEVNNIIKCKLQDYTKLELCKFAKLKKNKGYSKLNKVRLIEFLIPLSILTDFPLEC